MFQRHSGTVGMGTIRIQGEENRRENSNRKMIKAEQPKDETLRSKCINDIILAT